jgi:GTPase
MKSVRKVPYFVKSAPDVVTAIKGIANEKFTPIFQLSNVRGDGLDLIRLFLNLVPPRMQWCSSLHTPAEVIVDESYFVAGVGTVIGGTVTAGRVKSGETLLLGPDGTGQFIPVLVKSIHNRSLSLSSFVFL